MGKSNVRLSSSEIGGLWSMYTLESLSICLLKYFIHHLHDDQIKGMLQKGLNLSQSHLTSIRAVFVDEQIPVPIGYSDEDIDFSSPPLFHDPFALSFVYNMTRFSMINSSFITANVARPDILEFFAEATRKSVALYTECVEMLLSKGLYDRPPMIEYPSQTEYISKQSYLDGFLGNKRPLNAIELTELFFNIERNYFGVLLTLGFLQVVKDKEIKQYIKRGKAISENQIETFNKLLQEENMLGLVPVSMEVTDSTTSPFSERLVMSLMHFLNSLDITLIGHALSTSMRTDLAVHYSKLIGEILLYAKDGFDIMVERKWLEQPPHATNRKQLIGT